MNLSIVPLAKRPDLLEAIWSDELMSNWPAFMLEDPTANLYFAPGRFERFLEFMLVAFDAAQPERVLARAFSVPFALGEPFNRPALPSGGWDAVVRWADQDALVGREANAVSALEMTLHPALKGQGASRLMLDALKRNTSRLGFETLYAPVRPTHKALEPLTPMADYAFRIREDGLPSDPWLRVHVRAGGEIVKVAPTSMVIAGTLEQWRSWTGLPFDSSGPTPAPGALSPVQVDVEQDYAVYVEANVWVRHRCSPDDAELESGA